MPRRNRADEAGSIYIALNRGNSRQTVFRKDEDYEAFLCVLAEGLERYLVDSFLVLPHAQSLAPCPAANQDRRMGRMLRWVTATQTQRYHAPYHTSGDGHLYQSRIKIFPIQNDAHVLVSGLPSVPEEDPENVRGNKTFPFTRRRNHSTC
ncbi:hypothetical protein Rcae01_02714 [Novipirellula caenicola]|uniref:Uncharacterized protein n=1 Tax=Novipirellula caenicola TaxID=1536901 RepID=A0ABP9VQ26_9BACT